jgi:hypothetical protein
VIELVARGDNDIPDAEDVSVTIDLVAEGEPLFEGVAELVEESVSVFVCRAVKDVVAQDVAVVDREAVALEVTEPSPVREGVFVWELVAVRKEVPENVATELVAVVEGVDDNVPSAEAVFQEGLAVDVDVVVGLELNVRVRDGVYVADTVADHESQEDVGDAVGEAVVVRVHEFVIVVRSAIEGDTEDEVVAEKVCTSRGEIVITGELVAVGEWLLDDDVEDEGVEEIVTRGLLLAEDDVVSDFDPRTDSVEDGEFDDERDADVV